MSLKRMIALCAAMACSQALGQLGNLLFARVGDDAAEAAFKAVADLGGDGVAMSQKAARLADGFGADALDGAADFTKHISDAGLSGADALGKIMRLSDVSESRKIFEAAGSWADDAAFGTAREACEGVAKWAAHADLDPADIARVIDELSHSAAQGYFTAAGKTLGDGVANGIDRVKDSFAALKATPKTGGVDSAVAGMLDSTIPTVKNFHALRNLDPKSLTAAQADKFKAIRNGLGAPGNGEMLQKVIPVGRIDDYIQGRRTGVEGFVTKSYDVSDLTTTQSLINELRLDYSGSPYKGTAEVGVLAFPKATYFRTEIPYGSAMGGNFAETYPCSLNGLVATRSGRAIPESVLKPLQGQSSVAIPEGALLKRSSASGMEIVARFINGKWEVL